MFPYPRELLERAEQWNFDRKGSEEEILEELEGKSVDDLEDEDVSVRELEVLARNFLSDEWDVEDDLVDRPMFIHRKGLNPAASFEDWRIDIPKADPGWSLVEAWDRYVPDRVERSPYLDDEDLNTSAVEDVFHEVGHNLNCIADGSSGYETLEEYMFHEAMAMAAVLEITDDPGEYYKSRESEVRDLADRSPEGHIDRVLDHREEYLQTLSDAIQMLEDIDFRGNDHVHLNRELKQTGTELKDLRNDRGLLTVTGKDMSVKEQFENDLFDFQRLMSIGRGAHELTPVGSSDSDEYDFMVRAAAHGGNRKVFTESDRELRDRWSGMRKRMNGVLEYTPGIRGFNPDFDEVYEVTPAKLGDRLQSYIETGMEVTDNVSRGELAEYRQNLINSQLENFGLPGHSLGYELGRRIQESGDYDVSELAGMTEEKAIKELQPLMRESQEELDINLPLDLRVEYYSRENQVERKHIYDVVGD
ncbi:MAG: hypothetical protein ABEK10_02475 [Candidatus Nanosalina sp.]